MCGIFAVLGEDAAQAAVRPQARADLIRRSARLRHRGPDGTGVAIARAASGGAHCFMAHERLNIVDTSPLGAQPQRLSLACGAEITWMCNGEIYNHARLREEELAGAEITGHSDCAVIGHLYLKHGPDFVGMLDGVFALAVFDGRDGGSLLVARDAMGISPCYVGRGGSGSLYFASELKAIHDVCVGFEALPPGHLLRCGAADAASASQAPVSSLLRRWYAPRWIADEAFVPSGALCLRDLRQTVIDAVVKRLMTDVPFGVLLSGGLDSSLIAAIAVRHLKEANNCRGRDERVHTFSIGIRGAPDLEAARKVADHLGTVHHEFHFTVQEGIDAVPDLMYHIESFEQVRAATPMYLLARRIKAMGIKMVLSGEGADELFGGYLYFHKAPSREEFHRECVRKTSRLHLWDVCRANKAPFSFGLETRVPYLDKSVMDKAFSFDPAEKMIDMAAMPDGAHRRMEKYILRKAFDDRENPYLPAEVLWRQKEQFSDGVGWDWVDGLKVHAEQVVTPQMWAVRSKRFPYETPRTKEYYLLRMIFEEHFPEESALLSVPTGKSIACSTPEACLWHKEWANTHEISGRAIASVHVSATEGRAIALDAAEQDERRGQTVKNLKRQRSYNTFDNVRDGVTVEV